MADDYSPYWTHDRTTVPEDWCMSESTIREKRERVIEQLAAAMGISVDEARKRTEAALISMESAGALAAMKSATTREP